MSLKPLSVAWVFFCRIAHFNLSSLASFGSTAFFACPASIKKECLKSLLPPCFGLNKCSRSLIAWKSLKLEVLITMYACCCRNIFFTSFPREKNRRIGSCFPLYDSTHFDRLLVLQLIVLHLPHLLFALPPHLLLQDLWFCLLFCHLWDWDTGCCKLLLAVPKNKIVLQFFNLMSDGGSDNNFGQIRIKPSKSVRSSDEV